ncbi:alpha/beta hydrolase [Ferruginibacter sp.]|nr:prolyl oligopeptidase family serine peptidase [Ferruginibacter sp.]
MNKFWKLLLKTVLVLFILINIITAFHAYKFTHFYDVGEVTVKNKGEKTGWDKTKEILFGINAVKQQNTVADTANQKVILTTSDKIKLEGWYTTVDSAKGTVCLFHGHGGKKSGNNTEAEAFRKMGYNTFQIDFRAHGSSSGNTCTIGYFESEDVKLAYDFVKNNNEKNIILWGISMGAAAVTKAVNDYPLQPNKIILEMPFGSITEAAEGRIKMMGLPPQPLATLITFWGGTEHGFWAFNMKPSEFAKKINCPALLQWGKNDPRVSQKETDDIYSNINSTKKLVVYENSGHESLCKNENEKWMREISDFLK